MQLCKQGLIENAHPFARELVGSIEFFQSPARALLPKSVAFGLAEAQKAHCISEHDALDLEIAVSHGPQEKYHHVWERPGGKQFGKAFFLRDHRPISAVEQPLVAVVKVLFEGFHAINDFPTGTYLEDLAKRADVRVGLGRIGENLSYGPLQHLSTWSCGRACCTALLKCPK